jgi:hypothetical protein
LEKVGGVFATGYLLLNLLLEFVDVSVGHDVSTIAVAIGCPVGFGCGGSITKDNAIQRQTLSITQCGKATFGEINVRSTLIGLDGLTGVNFVPRLQCPDHPFGIDRLHNTTDALNCSNYCA